MTVKSDLLKSLQDESQPSQDRLTALIRCARGHHMSVNSLEKIYSELFGTADSPTNRPVTVESIVRAMLDRLSSSSKETRKKPSDKRTNTQAQ